MSFWKCFGGSRFLFDLNLVTKSNLCPNNLTLHLMTISFQRLGGFHSRMWVQKHGCRGYVYTYNIYNMIYIYPNLWRLKSHETKPKCTSSNPSVCWCVNRKNQGTVIKGQFSLDGEILQYHQVLKQGDDFHRAWHNWGKFNGRSSGS